MTPSTAPERAPVRRLLIATHYFPPHVGGIERVALMEANELSKRDMTVEVLTSTDRSGATPDIDERVSVVRVRSANPLERRGVPFPVFWLPSLIRKAWRAARRADVAHVHDALYMSSWVVALVCRILRTPYVVTQHVAVVAHPSAAVDIVQRLVYATFGRLVWRGARTVFYLNSRVHDSLVEWGVPTDRLRPLMNGVDVAQFCPASSDDERLSIRNDFGLPTDAPLALFVGRLVPKKGYLKVVEAAGQQSAWTAVMVGNGAPVAQATNVVWLGERNQDELSRLYRACDVFVLPSEAEGFPLTVQEAMASGLPVITSSDPGYDMYDLDTRLICLLTPGYDSLGHEIAGVLGNEDRRKQMSAYSRDVALSQFTWARHVDQLLDAIKEPA